MRGPVERRTVENGDQEGHPPRLLRWRGTLLDKYAGPPDGVHHCDMECPSLCLSWGDISKGEDL